MQVWARDPNRVRKGLLTPLSAQCVLRESGVGTWSITVDEDAGWSPAVDEGWGVVVEDDDGTPLFSGPLTQIEINGNGQTRDVTYSGETDMSFLARRVVYPDPDSGFNAQTTVSHYKAKGPSETLILDLIRGQLLPDHGWPTAVREIPGLVLPADFARGAVTSVEGRWGTVLDEVKALAVAGGLTVDVLQDGTDLKVTIRVPVDRSRAVRFMPGHGLGDYSIRWTAPTATTVIIGGQGEGTARAIYGRSASDAARWGAQRIEQFRDRRDTADADEIDKELTEALLEGGPSGSASFTVTETPHQRFGTHYRLGDIVTVALPNGGEITNGVRTAEITWDEHGRDVRLTVGDHSTDEENAPGWATRYRNLLRRVRGLETRL